MGESNKQSQVTKTNPEMRLHKKKAMFLGNLGALFMDNDGLTVLFTS